MQTVFDNLDLLELGLRNTLQLSAVIIALGTAIGLFGGLGLLFGPLPVRGVLRGYESQAGLAVTLLGYFVVHNYLEDVRTA